ncbi:hypothetical protein ACQKII_13540 [Lysinibacillus sp. NPDC048646]|uniref:hypothetical protein n=1 Tax=Lysinibacillus sp. NPDC048646 TaxID=3390574 RepID=UPI003CFFCEB8
MFKKPIFISLSLFLVLTPMSQALANTSTIEESNPTPPSGFGISTRRTGCGS